jgi:hypothetical protein
MAVARAAMAFARVLDAHSERAHRSELASLCAHATETQRSGGARTSRILDDR